jgi:hypothetical protein
MVSATNKATLSFTDFCIYIIHFEMFTLCCSRILESLLFVVLELLNFRTVSVINI